MHLALTVEITYFFHNVTPLGGCYNTACTLAPAGVSSVLESPPGKKFINNFTHKIKLSSPDISSTPSRTDGHSYDNDASSRRL